MTTIEIPGSEITAGRADPPGAPRGALLVIHEIWGLVDHVTDVADRFAAEGYLVVAPDILSGAGVSPEVGQQLHDLVKSTDEAERAKAQPLLREKLAPSRSPEYGAWAVGQLMKVVDYAQAQPGIDGRIAVTGFCFGGSYSFALAAADPRIRAAVPFYGSPPGTADVSAIAGSVLAFYGDQDENLMTSLPAVRKDMEDAGIDFEAKVYPGARHAFFNDTNSLTYDALAAADAWRRTLAFLGRHLT